MNRVVFPGSFDPPTNGHLNLIQRAARHFDHVDVVISVNATKNYLFNSEERLSFLREMCSPWNNVEVHLWDRLIVDFARQKGARLLIRGVRALSDFSYEFELSMMNKGLDQEIDTLFIPTDPQFFVLRSSAIKELAHLGSDISSLVPPCVEAAFKRKYATSPDAPGSGGND